MITDKLLRVSAAQAVTTSAVSTDTIDLSQAFENLVSMVFVYIQTFHTF
jgi:hypothetical protein